MKISQALMVGQALDQEREQMQVTTASGQQAPELRRRASGSHAGSWERLPS
jgi:hypothetical protein